MTVNANSIPILFPGDLTLCQHGLLMSTWIKFNELEEDTYFVDSGPRGFKWYYKNGKMQADFQQGDKFWHVEWLGVETDQWYFLELAWKPQDGLRMYSWLEEVAQVR